MQIVRITLKAFLYAVVMIFIGFSSVFSAISWADGGELEYHYSPTNSEVIASCDDRRNICNMTPAEGLHYIKNKEKYTELRMGDDLLKIAPYAHYFLEVDTANNYIKLVLRYGQATYYCNSGSEVCERLRSRSIISINGVEYDTSVISQNCLDSSPGWVLSAGNKIHYLRDKSSHALDSLFEEQCEVPNTLLFNKIRKTGLGLAVYGWGDIDTDLNRQNYISLNPYFYDTYADIVSLHVEPRYVIGMSTIDKTNISKLSPQQLRLGLAYKDHAVEGGRSAWRFGSGVVIGNIDKTGLPRTYDGGYYRFTHRIINFNLLLASLGDRVQSYTLKDFLVGGIISAPVIDFDAYFISVLRKPGFDKNIVTNNFGGLFKLPLGNQYFEGEYIYQSGSDKYYLPFYGNLARVDIGTGTKKREGFYGGLNYLSASDYTEAFPDSGVFLGILNRYKINRIDKYAAYGGVGFRNGKNIVQVTNELMMMNEEALKEFAVENDLRTKFNIDDDLVIDAGVGYLLRPKKIFVGSLKIKKTF